MRINYYDLMSTTLDSTTNTVTGQLGDALNSEVVIDRAEVWQQVGFASRPSNVLESPEDAAQSLSIERADGEIIFASRDIRGQQIYGNLGEGDTCIYATGPDAKGQPRVYLDGATGGINLFTRKDNSEDGNGMGVFIDAESDTIRITNSAGNGIIIDQEGVKIFTSGTLIQAGLEETTIGGVGSVNIDGANVNIGSEAQNVTLNAKQKVSLGGAAAVLPVPHTISGGSGAPAVGIPSSKIFIAP